MRKFLLLFSVAALVAAGCQRSDDQTAGSTRSTGAPAPATGGHKTKIVFIPKSSGNPYFNEVIKGFEDAAKAAGADFTTVAPASADATSQIPVIKEQIQQKVDVIALSANSPDALNNVLDEARQAGILVITVDSDLSGNETHRDASVIAPTAETVGQSQIELLGSQINYEGDFAILSATRDAPNQNAWIAAMTETLKQPKYAKMKLVETVYGDDEPQKSTTETEALLSKHPGLRGIISPTSVGLAAAAQSIEIAGVYPGGPHASGPGLMLTGLSTPKQLRKFVDKGVVTGFQLWSPYDMGALGCNLAIGMKSGKITAKEGTEFDDPKLGKQKFDKNNVVHCGPLVTFEKSNIAKYDF